MELINWNKVVFSDESTFQLKPIERLYWGRGMASKRWIGDLDLLSWVDWWSCSTRFTRFVAFLKKN
jgi:hypothetical protein